MICGGEWFEGVQFWTLFESVGNQWVSLLKINLSLGSELNFVSSADK